MKSAGQKLKDLRNLYSISQAKFGERLGISRGSMSSYENDVNPIPDSVKQKIKEATGIGTEYFDTDMNIDDIFKQYNLSPDTLRLKSLTECIISCFIGIESFANNDDSKVASVVIRNDIQEFIMGFKCESCIFIKVCGFEAQPLASNENILIVLESMKPKFGNWVIAKDKNLVFVAQYLALKDRAILKTPVKNIELNQNIVIKGIIKAKIDYSYL